MNPVVEALDNRFKMTELGPLPDEWDVLDFASCIQKKRIQLPDSILTSDYGKSGSYPIIDQGKDFIAGYTDDASSILKEPLPVIIFGDHTRIFKYVDFPFAIGADGTKLIFPKTDEFDPKYLYLFFLSLDIASKGYSRHFKILKEKLIVKPHLPEQQKVAAVLSNVMEAKEKTEAVINATKELKRSMMKHLFTNGPVSLEDSGKVKLKETEIGEIPEHWEIIDFGQAANLFGGFAFKSEDFVKKSNTQLIRMGNLYLNKLDLNRQPVYLPDDFSQKYSRYLLEPQDLIISLTGTMGKEDYGYTVKIPESNRNLLLNQRVAKIVSHNAKLERDFLYYHLLSRKFLDYLYKTAKGTKQGNLSSNTILKIKLCIPPKDEQIQISLILSSIDRKIEIEEDKKQVLDSLFKSMLHNLMTGKGRVKDLEIPV